ncbi:MULTISPECIES: DHA2 family efflux MFS transporter permease subunit [unclassified Methylobacterium]|uniref:DHA2 family efflux MFS transporter permease subunit n=1 Tax=unclassified Methylobacterium TaxID=2615210 RepID=UPI0006FA9A87|nr:MULTISPECIES: DHA2 family efflux MFS transporter permease subunit [unclassified Methylobacterium]KQP95052.1 disulfide bond formation protein DsbA [Methylobacterium sp. Leaf113]MCK2054415.1 DHA2 family efflux MFS transporter permease subunit [Methylobacterium sp. 37f]
MSAADSGASAKAPGGHNPWAIALVVSLATFMEVLDTTIANVALRYISGGLAVGPDEAAWVVTSYLVANAIVLTASSFLAKRYGRKAFFMWSIALFTVASVLCGFAWNLESLLVFRVLQGLGGGGMAPLAQSILADSFPPAKRGQAFALYGLAVVVAPVIGPTLGGWLSDNVSWHWCFLINGPIGLMALGLMHMLLEDPPGAVEERKRLRREGVRFDLIGFLLVATFLGALEVVLDEGQRKDWFGSNFIVVFAVICAVAFVAMIPWELTRKNPVVDLRLLGSRQFGSCFLVMMATGAILIATTQFVPQLVQEYFGYTATLAGLVLAPGGLVTVLMMLVVGRISGKVQPKYLIAIGAAIVSAAMYDLTRLYGDTSFWFFAWSRIYIGIGLPLIFISITAASYDGIAKSQTDQASALINVARNVGGSMGVSLAQNVLAYRQQFHQSRLGESISSANPNYQEALRTATQYFQTHGASGVEAQNQAMAWIGQQLQTQVAYWGYIDVFWSLCLVSGAAVPLAMILRNVKLGGETPAGH